MRTTSKDHRPVSVRDVLIVLILLGFIVAFTSSGWV